MRRSGFSSPMLAAALALCAQLRPADEMTDEERKTPPPEPVFSKAQMFVSLPGETNRQFAARMKARDATPTQSQSNGE